MGAALTREPVGEGREAMPRRRLSIGVDFGTLSGRAVLVDVSNGEVLASSVLDYPHAIMSRRLPSGAELPQEWALQHPGDYLCVLETTIPELASAAQAVGGDVVGIGIDFTACTMLPISADGAPLCDLDRFRDEPNAYVKLWKHHSAQPYASRITEVAQSRNEPWLARYGERISSEWMFPKIWQTLDQAPDVFASADQFIEAGDWVVRMMTGTSARSAALAGYKAMWDPVDGFPSDSYWRALDSRLEGIADRLPGPYLPMGARAGELTDEMANRLGLQAGIPVAVANSDAYVCAPAIGVTGPRSLFSIVGTSTCTIVMGESFHEVAGISGIVPGGVLPGYWGYEAGQPAVGDLFAWFVRESVPAAAFAEAEELGLDIYAYMERLAARRLPGESGIVALDWWNGNRSVLVDGDLSGLFVGMTLHTDTADLYRSLLESTAYGMRTIVDSMVDRGVIIDEVTMSGGIPRKSPLLMQIYADVLGRTVRASQLELGPALGSAICGAVAAGAARGGYGTVSDAASAMSSRDSIIYEPDRARHEVYNELYREFSLLHDYFGRGGNDVMKGLRRIRDRVREEGRTGNG